MYVTFPGPIDTALTVDVHVAEAILHLVDAGVEERDIVSCDEQMAILSNSNTEEGGLSRIGTEMS